MASKKESPSRPLHINTRSLSTSPLDEQELESPLKKSKKVSSACDACRKRHARCNGENPCNHCSRQGNPCSFTLDDKRRRKSRNEQTWALENQVEELQSTLNVLKNGTGVEATEALKNLRSHLIEMSPGLPISRTASTPTSQQEPQRINFGSHARTKFTLGSLPDEQLLRKGIKSCFTTHAGIFWIDDQEDINIVCDNVFRARAKSVVDLAELCAFAAAGWQYEIGSQDSQKEVLFRIATQYIYDAIDLGGTKAVRVLTCLAIYGILNAKPSSRSLVCLAMQVLRSIQTSPTEPRWRRVCRTVVILDCWLSTLMGYPMISTQEEVGHIQDEMNVNVQTTDEMSEVKILQITYLRTQIINLTRNASTLRYPVIEENMARLATWHANLPPDMALSSLMEDRSEKTQAFFPRALLLIHVLYLGAILSLHRQVLIAIADHALLGSWPLDPSLQTRAKEYYESAVEAARSSARIFIFSNLGDDIEKTFLRCWICSFEVVSFCTVLLYDIAFRLSSGRWTILEIDEDLERTKSCLGLLNGEVGTDTVVEQLNEVMDSASTAWLSIKSLPSSTNTTPITTDGTSSSGADPRSLSEAIITQIQRILKNPLHLATLDDSAEGSTITT